ncbi:NAD(P)/FAD-dependent oxidoreductase [Leisingera sp. ANG59]|uniref:NAD(P)/FAD-dependent oxidoreductase n=1 Tax=Leisingera sp. ANG59 TaxID=2675221 RepID=UPI0015731DC7|nr:FAD-dependent oxidoreductase [Leisingera sp. ANG59]NSY39358.1 pyridine nucleotide-disulfide oxidoreductase [Leisingera sp. ANG59]
MKQIVIIGAGQAGLSCAAKLRADGFEGEITLIGNEKDAPYQRPPLSKAYLLGNLDAERLLLRPLTWYDQHQVDLRTGVAVATIDRAGKAVTLSDGKSLSYDALVLATGAEARPLPEDLLGGRSGVHTIRDRSDIEMMRPELDAAQSVLVIGGGYIGLEMAAVARGLGLGVNVVEAAPALLGRVACRETAAAIAELHEERGVRLHIGQGVTELTGETQVTGARLADGTEISADVVIVGIGAAPRTALAEAAGLDIANGILVDATGRTSDPAIYAAGDCACYRLPDGDLRLESVGNAIDTGEVVAGSILESGAGYTPKPWFWSDQFDLKLQIAGRAQPGDMIVVRISTIGARSHWYYRDGVLAAIDALNSPRAYQVGRKLILDGLTPDPGAIADPHRPIKDIFNETRAALFAR